MENEKKGRLKIFLGMIAGVGKTHAMITSAQVLKKNGSSVCVGLIDSHGRFDIDKMLKGLPILPHSIVTHEGKIFKELNVAEIVRRRPEIVLVDELAHTNAPGARHEKRYQDVLDLLNEGIDVYTTLNVQHIESCAGLVQNLTGTAVAETLPDSILDIANEVILIDLDPDQILERLKAGKIYPLDQMTPSMEAFFKKSNLIALRETVLRLLADRVNVELRDLKVVHGIPQIWKTSFRILVPILPSADGEYLLRMTRRLASGLNARWVAAQVVTRKNYTPEAEAYLKKNALLAKQLGAEVTSIQDTSFSNGIGRLINEYQVTHLVISRKQKNLLKQLTFLSNCFPEVDVIFLSPDKKNNKGSKKLWKNFSLQELWTSRSLLTSLVLLGLLTAVLFHFLPLAEYQTAGMAFMLFLSLNSLFSPPLVVVFITLLTGFLWNFLFIPPRYSLNVLTFEDLLILFGFLGISLLIGLQTAKIKAKGKIVDSIDERLGFMYFLTKNLFEASGIQKIVQLTLERLTKNFGVRSGVILASREKEKQLEGFIMGGLILDDQELSAAHWAFLNKRSAGRFTDTLASSKGMYFPICYKNLTYGVLCILPEEKFFSSDQISIFEDVARHLALVIEKELLAEKTRELHIHQASEKIYSKFLNSISQDLGGPLSNIKDVAEKLSSEGITSNPISLKKNSEELYKSALQIQDVVQSILDVGRIEAGKVKLHKDAFDIKEIARSIQTYVTQHFPEKKFELIYEQEQFPLVLLDDSLIEQALKNLVHNACLYAPMDTPLTLSISKQARDLKLCVRDRGPGLPSRTPNIVFEKFYHKTDKKSSGAGIGLTITKGIVELHEGTIEADNHPQGGAVFTIKVPAFKES